MDRVGSILVRVTDGGTPTYGNTPKLVTTIMRRRLCERVKRASVTSITECFAGSIA